MHQRRTLRNTLPRTSIECGSPLGQTDAFFLFASYPVSGERHESFDDRFGSRRIRRDSIRLRHHFGRCKRRQIEQQTQQWTPDHSGATAKTRQEVRQELVHAQKDGQLAALKQLYQGS
jgi:hypothetical protein